VLDAGTAVCGAPLLFIIYIELDRPSRRGCHCRELQDQPFVLCGRCGTARILSTGLQNALIGFLLLATNRGWKWALKRPVCYVCPETQGSVCCNWAAIHCSRSRCSSTVSRGGIVRVAESGTRRLHIRIGKANAVLCELYRFVAEKRGISNMAKLSVF